MNYTWNAERALLKGGKSNLYSPIVSHKYAELHVPADEHHSGKPRVILKDTLAPHTGRFSLASSDGGKMMVTDYNDPGYRPKSTLNLAGFLARSAVNGPGIRAVVWVQGCPFQCRGCFNEQFRSFSPATLLPVEKLAADILAIRGIDGVTFSGGEPFAQAGPLAELGTRLRSAGLSVVTYSGYTAEQLAQGNDPAWPALMAASDLLVTGPFVAKLAALDPLKGSSNQQVISLGMRITDPYLPPGPRQLCGRMEFTITPDGTITATGFPETALLNRIASRCREA
jgi:anaerobic ribonucleoside-triphosphate reductase activating protein